MTHFNIAVKSSNCCWKLALSYKMSGLIEIHKPMAKRRKQETEESKFRIYINKGEMERILEWVKLKPDIETGMISIIRCFQSSFVPSIRCFQCKYNSCCMHITSTSYEINAELYLSASVYNDNRFLKASD